MTESQSHRDMQQFLKSELSLSPNISCHYPNVLHRQLCCLCVHVLEEADLHRQWPTASSVSGTGLGSSRGLMTKWENCSTLFSVITLPVLLAVLFLFFFLFCLKTDFVLIFSSHCSRFPSSFSPAPSFCPRCDSGADKPGPRYQAGHPCRDPLGKNQFHTEPIS